MPRTANQRKQRRLVRYNNRIINKNIIYDIKHTTPCGACEQYFFSFYLDFHHLRGEKKGSVGRFTNATRTKLLREIRKCTIVCCRCHRLIHQSKIRPILEPISIKGPYE